MPEGDTLHRAAKALQPLAGRRIAASSPHPRAQAEGVAEQVDGRVLESVEAFGKNLVLRFSGGVVVRSHLRMTGRWTVRPAGETRGGRPWLVLRAGEVEGVLWNGPVLELHTRALARLGPDILERPPQLDAMLARLRGGDRTRPLGEALVDQTLVAGIGNMWVAEALWSVELSPWRRLESAEDADLLQALGAAATLMRASVDGGRGTRHVYRRAGRPCPRCGTAIRAWGLGDANRTAYWCPACQRGEEPRGAY